MMFDKNFFIKQSFMPAELARYRKSAKRDLDIAHAGKEPEVVFHFAYMALIKIGIYCFMEQEIQSQPQQPINPIPSPVRKINKKIIVIIILAIIAMIIGYYGWRIFTVHYDKLGELSFYKDVNMELKVVLIHENLPFHYVGNSYSVACQSQTTQAPSNDEYEWKFDRIEKGWNAAPQAYLGNGLGNNSNLLLKNLADEAKKLYLVRDKNTLVILANPNVYVSFDGCRTFNNWILKDSISPDLLVESTPEFEKCVEQQKKDKELGLTSYGSFSRRCC